MSARQFTDIPLPGLDLGVPADSAPQNSAFPAHRATRRYDSDMMPTSAAIAAFHARIVRAPGNGCWLFTGAISSPDGYGRITWRSGGASRTLSAHRFALLVECGPGALDAVAEHRCNEPLCVRVDPDHVRWSTQTANLAYAVACGRAGAHRVDSAGRSRVQRSRDVRSAIAGGWDPIAYARAAGETLPTNTPTLF